MAFKSPAFQPLLKRPLGNHEIFLRDCHNKQNGAMNQICGLTLVTRHQIDEGLLKCSLQEFQHMFPYLTSRIKVQPSSISPNTTEENNILFVPMECPILPLDTSMNCIDMLHETFDEENGPLWRVQHVTEDTMDAANLRFGPELSAIVEDDADNPTRWRYFLRYMQGKVNQKTIDPFDSTEEGYRNFILFAFHPSVTDTMGIFHMLRQFLVILDSILSKDGNTAPPPNVGVGENTLPPPMEQLVPNGFGLNWSYFNGIKEYIYPRKSPLEFLSGLSEDLGHTHVLRGWLSESETRELLAIMEEKEMSLHGVLLSAAIASIGRMLENENLSFSSIKVANDVNLRQICNQTSKSGAPKLGCFCSSYEQDYQIREITTRREFWNFAHDLTLKHNQAKDHFSVKADRKILVPYWVDMSVASHGNLGLLFRNKSFSEVGLDSIDTWSKPLNEVLQTNIRLEDVFHMTNCRNMGVAFHHSGHILHGKLNYILTYDTNLIKDQRHALMVRDEISSVLRMAVDNEQD